MHRNHFFILIFTLLFLCTSANGSENFTVYNHSSFSISVPTAWHVISKKQLNSFVAIQAKRQGLSVNPDWLVYECGFQKQPLKNGISLPLITIKIDKNKKLYNALSHQLSTMSKEEISLTYQEAAKQLVSELTGIIQYPARNIIFNKDKQMLRFTIEINNVKTLTFLYVRRNTIYHIICSMNSLSDSNNLILFEIISESFLIN